MRSFAHTPLGVSPGTGRRGEDVQGGTIGAKLRSWNLSTSVEPQANKQPPTAIEWAGRE